jgi:hypothetical protein
MVRSKEDLVKSINAALMIGSIMLYISGTLFSILFLVLGYNENTLEDYIVFGGFFLLFLLIPAISLQLFRRKYWVKKHVDILRKKETRI